MQSFKIIINVFKKLLKWTCPLQRAKYAAKSTTETEGILEVHEWQVCVWKQKLRCLKVFEWMKSVKCAV